MGFEDQYLEGIERYQEGGILTNIQHKANAGYRDEIEIKSDSDLIFFFPTALFQYWFEPMPWRINRIIDAALFFENLLRGYLIWRAFVGIRKISGRGRNVMFFVFFSYLALEFIWSLGTMNWGTAVRHHLPSFGLLVLAAFFYSKPKKLKLNPITPVNVVLRSSENSDLKYPS